MANSNKKPDYFALLQSYFTKAISINNNQVKLDHRSIECTISNFNNLVSKQSNILFKFIENPEEESKFFLQNLNWLYSYLLFFTVHNDGESNSSFNINILELFKRLIVKSARNLVQWITMLVDHQIQFLKIFEEFFKLTYPYVVKIPMSNGSKLEFAQVIVQNKDQLNRIISLSFELLTYLHEFYPASVRVTGNQKSIAELSLNVFCESEDDLSLKITVFSFLIRYMECHDDDDTIAIITKIMKGNLILWRFKGQNIKEKQEFYANDFQNWLILFCDATLLKRSHQLNFHTTEQQKDFIITLFNSIYYECTFSKQYKIQSIIEKLVETTDTIMLKNDYIDESISFCTESLYARADKIDISEVFPLYKYSIILSLEKATAFDKKVTTLSDMWNKLHEKLIKKTSPSSENLTHLEFQLRMEYIHHILLTASQTYDLFTHRHQIRHIKGICNECHSFPKLPCDEQISVTLKNYHHIHLDFFDIKTIAGSIIEQVSQCKDINSGMAEIVFKVFALLLKLSSNSRDNQLSDEQKTYILSVIFFPFYSMMEINVPYKNSRDVITMRKSLPTNFKIFLKSTITKQPNMWNKFKIDVINYMTQVKVSKLGDFSMWLVSSVMHYLLTHEQSEQLKRHFEENFMNILITNAENSSKFLDIFKSAGKNILSLKSIMCFVNKDVIIVKKFPKESFKYEFFCKSCDMSQVVCDDSERSAFALWKGNGSTIISIDHCIIKEININYLHFLNSPQGQEQFIKLLASFIRHDYKFLAVFNIHETINILLSEKNLCHSAIYADKIIKIIIEDNRIDMKKKIEFFKIFLETLKKLVPSVKVNDNNQIRINFITIVGVYGKSVKFFPPSLENKQLFQNERTTNLCFKMLIYLIFGKTNATTISWAVKTANAIFKANDMTFKENIQRHRKSLLPYICNLALREYALYSTPLYNILDNFFALFGCFQFQTFLNENFTEMLAILLPMTVAVGRNEPLQSILNYATLDIYDMIYKSPITLYECFYSLPVDKRTVCQNYIETEANGSIKDLLMDKKIQVVQMVSAIYSTKPQFFVDTLKFLLTGEEEEMGNFEEIIQFITDHFLAITLHFRQTLNREDEDLSVKESILRSVGELLRFIGTKNASEVCFKVMGMLKATYAMEFNKPFKEFYIEIWRLITRTCEANTLGPLLSTLFVSLEAFIDEYPDKVESIVEYVLSENFNTLSTYFSDLFFIEKTSYSKEIKEAIITHIESQNILQCFSDLQTNMQRIIEHLNSENTDSDVKYYSLLYLYEYTKTNRSKMKELVKTSKEARDLFGDLLCILAECSRNRDNEKLLFLTAKCLGEIGALKGEEFIPIQKSVVNYGFDIKEEKFVLHLLNILCKYYRDLQCSNYMESLAIGIQYIIKDYNIEQTMTDPLWSKLSKATRVAIKPLFKSRYCPHYVNVNKNQLIFWKQAQTSNSWADLMVSKLIQGFHDKNIALFFSAINSSIRYYTEIASFVLPYIFLNYFELTSEFECDDFILNEFNYIFDILLSEKYESKFEGDFKTENSPIYESYNVACEIGKFIFNIIDFLNRFINQNYDQKSILGNRIRSFVSQLKNEKIAMASFVCGEYQTALIYYEAYMATLTDEEKKNCWSFLVQLYAKLGDADSIEGVAEKKIVSGLKWTANEKLLVGNITGIWKEPFVSVEELIRTSTINVNDVTNTMNCFIQYNQIEQGIATGNRMLEKLYHRVFNRYEANIHANTHAEALLRLSQFDEVEDILEAYSDYGIFDWDILKVKLLLTLRSDNFSNFLDEIKLVRLSILNNLKLYDTNASIYKLNYNQMIQLHMVTDIDKAGELINNLRSRNHDDSAEKLIENFINDITDRKALFPLTSIQSESFASLHRLLLKEVERTVENSLDSQHGGDIITKIRNEIGRGWVECAKMYCREGQSDQANAFLLAAEEYSPPDLFVERAKCEWKNHHSIRTLKLLTYQCNELLKNPANKNNPHLANGLLTIARYSGDAAVADDKLNRELYKKVFNCELSSVEYEKAFFFYADYLDRIIIAKNESNINKIQEEKVAEILEAYGKSLSFGNTYVLQSLPRFLQIWFDATTPVPSTTSTSSKHRQLLHEKAVLNDIVHKYSTMITSYQFYTAYSTLISRIAHSNLDVIKILKNIIKNLISSYPQQSMWYVVYAIKNKTTSIAVERMADILRTMPREKGYFDEFGHFIDKIMSLSKCDDGLIPTNIEKVNAVLRKIKFPILIPSQLNLTPSKLNSDGEFVYINKVEDKVQIMHSLQRPKKISFFGSNGKQYPMLLKAKDDLRIDFRFMEFLKVLNDYFHKDREASRHHFSIRTYTVIPINHEIGLIEWMNNCNVMGGVIKEQYALMNISMKDKVNFVQKIWIEKGRDKIDIFNEAKSMFPPVLSKWYQRHFINAPTYFSARQQYIKSVAIMSIVGYMFGLGDRHLENILVDLSSGEIAHVDFNSVFNSAEQLKFPETVPFRLTQSMIEAMGVLGIDGPFTNCCKLTLHLLQSRKNVLMSYLRPFVFDPLIRHFTQDSNEPVNNEAQYAIAMIKKKLDGYVRVYKKFTEIPLSVEGQVNLLIQEATSDENLSVMFVHWNPFI